MSEPFIGEIKIFAGNFAPRGWALCDGQLLAISQNDALFSLLGTIYGGDGRTTFALPDMRGRLPIHQGTGTGLSERRIGSKGGAERVTLSANELATHNHAMNPGGAANADFPGGHFPANTGSENSYSLRGALDVDMGVSTDAAGSAGPQSHNNIMPYLSVNYIIALTGTYPSRS